MKIVALAAEPSIAAALNMMEESDVFYTSEPDEIVSELPGTAVVLIGGGTEDGLELAEYVRTLGVTIPIVIVGDIQPPAGARYPVVTRPFTLAELRSTIDGAVIGSAQSMPSTHDVSTPPSTSAGATRENAATRVEPLDVTPEPRDVAVPRAPEVAGTPAGEITRADATAGAPVRQLQREDSPVVLPEAGQEHPPALRKRVDAAGRGLLRRRPKEEAAPPTDPMAAALQEAYYSLAAVERAIDQVPVLIDLAELTQALLGEVLNLLWPQTAAIYLPGPDGFRVWASHGFSNVEKTMAVQTTQPLFVDLLVRHESVLIEPLDMAQQLAGGVGGARTIAFLATPIEVNQKCVGVIVAGREHFENSDLDNLAALAHEAALGLGIALGLDRLRTKFS